MGVYQNLGFGLVFSVEFEVSDGVAVENWISQGFSKKNEEPLSRQERGWGRREEREKYLRNWGFLKELKGFYTKV